MVSQHSITGRALKFLRALNLSNSSSSGIRIAALLLALLQALLLFPRIHARLDKPSAPTFYRDVLPILQNHCQVCHRTGEIGPMPLLTYAQTQPLARAIATDVREKTMPPWFADPTVGHFSNDPSLTNQEIATLVSWADSNAPAGNASDAPPPRHWTPGWLIPHPDTVIKMPKPVAIAAQGDVDYTYEIVPTHFTEDKWVQFSEIRPSSPANVHHAVVYVRPPNSNWLQHAPIDMLFTDSYIPVVQDSIDQLFSNSNILLFY
jgi:hypothetical protein